MTESAVTLMKYIIICPEEEEKNMNMQQEECVISEQIAQFLSESVISVLCVQRVTCCDSHYSAINIG